MESKVLTKFYVPLVFDKNNEFGPLASWHLALISISIIIADVLEFGLALGHSQTFKEVILESM
jgi:hypothetical protein